MSAPAIKGQSVIIAQRSSGLARGWYDGIGEAVGGAAVPLGGRRVLDEPHLIVRGIASAGVCRDEPRRYARSAARVVIRAAARLQGAGVMPNVTCRRGEGSSNPRTIGTSRSRSLTT